MVVAEIPYFWCPWNWDAGVWFMALDIIEEGRKTMDKKTSELMLREMRDTNKQIKEMKEDTNYQLRRIATRLEQMNK